MRTYDDAHALDAAFDAAHEAHRWLQQVIEEIEG